MAKDPYRYFRIEAAELLQQMARSALDLEKEEAGGEPVMRLLRLAHTLKGAARVVRLVDFADLAHGMEESLAPFRDGSRAVPRESVDRILAAVDTMTGKLAALPQADAAAASAIAAPPAQPATRPIAGAAAGDGKRESRVESKDGAEDKSASENSADSASEQGNGSALRLARTDIAEVDVVLESLGEIGNELEALQRVEQTLEKMRALGLQMMRQHALPQARQNAVAAELLALAGSAERNLAAGLGRVRRELGETRDAAQRLRLVPVTSIFTTLERTARDAAHHTGKQVQFHATGGDVRIDGAVLDAVQSAMIQLVRNALAHGIETPAHRRLAAKAPAGNVHVEVTRRGYHACFSCRDDGAGIDLDAVRRAIAAGNVGSGAPRDLQALGTRELIALLLEGGVSTSTAVSEISGRGIGLNLVRETLLELNGDMHAESTPGQGTRFELRVPLSLAALQVLTIECGGQVAALPLDAVRRTLRVAREDILHLAEGESIAHEGSHIPLLTLKLGARRDGAARALTAVVIGNASGHYAIGVDRLLGMEQVVLRPLPAMAPADPIVLGLCLDIEGNPRLVLDPEQFRDDRRNQGLHSGLHSALQSSSQATAPAAPHPILIVDDSLTTRMLECSILESAGFQVGMAASAEEGLELANRNNYSLFLVDVEMPGIDGFEFVARTRANPALKDTPCILVTSRNAPEDLQRGRACGASDYIVKGEFDQIRFLQRVTELVQPAVVPVVPIVPPLVKS